MAFFYSDLEAMVPENEVLRTFKERLLVEGIGQDRDEMKQCLGREGYGCETGLRALFLQFYGNHSDRQAERQLRYNFLYRWFCGFTMESQAPDHTFFCRVRKAMGPERILEMHHRMVDDAKLRRIIKPFESFVDASAIRRKEAAWAARDRQIEEEERQLEEDGERFRKEQAQEEKRGRQNTPENVKKFSADTASGLIEKIVVTPANVNDADAFPLICPWEKRILADRGYDTWLVRQTMKKKGCIDRVVFAHMRKRTRYRGVKKTYLQAIMEAIVWNLKRLVWLEGVNPPVIGTA